jgi:hypothetical protein
VAGSGVNPAERSGDHEVGWMRAQVGNLCYGGKRRDS